MLFYLPQMSQACRHQWRNRCSAHPHTCPSHCDQTVEIVIFFFTILIKVVMNIKLHASPHTCPKGSCDLKDECNHLHWFENVLLSLFWSSAVSTIITTLHWFEDVRVCLRLSFPIRGLPGSAGACSELESCSCYDLFAVFVITVFVTVFVLSLSLISRSVGCQSACSELLLWSWLQSLLISFFYQCNAIVFDFPIRACSELKSSFSSLFLLLWSRSLFI